MTTNKLTLRIYDHKFFENLLKVYSKFENKFESKNHYYITLLELGYQQYSLMNKLRQDESQFVEIHKKLDELIDILNRLSRNFIKSSEMTDVHIKVLERLSSSILASIIGLTNGEPLVAEDIENGEYDMLPERLENLILNERYK